MKDVRDEIFRDIADKKITAAIIADDEGIVVELEEVGSVSRELGLRMKHSLETGNRVKKGETIAEFIGSPKQVAMAEDRLIGLMAKPSGIASAARRFVEKANSDIQIVSGAWKKLHLSQKEIIRRAITAGGASCRICSEPFLYIDKNYVKMLGGIKESLSAINRLIGFKKVIQVKGNSNDINEEALEAANYGADIIFIDTGKLDDLNTVSGLLTKNGSRAAVKLAFAGNIRLKDLEALKSTDVDILDIGRAVIDAPLLDMKMEVLNTPWSS